MDLTPYLAPFMCFLGSVTIAVSYNVPARALLACGLLGNLAWYGQLYCSSQQLNDVASNFLAALVVACAAEVVARRLRLPVTCLSAPGVIPLVPGFKTYNALMLYVNHSYMAANDKILEALMIAAAISAALATANSVFMLLPGTKRPWHNPQSPVDDRVLTASGLYALRNEVLERVRQSEGATPPPGSD